MHLIYIIPILFPISFVSTIGKHFMRPPFFYCYHYVYKQPQHSKFKIKIKDYTLYDLV